MRGPLAVAGFEAETNIVLAVRKRAESHNICCMCVCLRMKAESRGTCDSSVRDFWRDTAFWVDVGPYRPWFLRNAQYQHVVGMASLPDSVLDFVVVSFDTWQFAPSASASTASLPTQRCGVNSWRGLLRQADSADSMGGVLVLPSKCAQLAS